MPKLCDISGKRFNRWTVLSRAEENDRFGKPMWVCQCDCGNIRTISGASLKSGNSKSCGCLKNEAASARASTHGQANTRLYGIWQGIKKRCENKNCSNYKNYGGRGIKVCAEWNTFENFFQWAMNNGYSESLTIDRIDTDGNYDPNNCRWVDYITQANNKRNNRLITVFGETHTMSEWSKIKHIPYSRLNSRVNQYKMNDEQAVLSPKGIRRK